jgi:hypothetical protein
MQKKDSSGMKNAPQAKLTIITNFLAKIMRLSNSGKMMDIGGRVGGNQVFTGAPGKGTGFRQNQRMERKLTRVRKMKPSAR